MKLLFCCHDFGRENLRLMPWRYIYEVAKGLVRRGHQVSLISLASPRARETDHLDGITVCSLDKKELFVGRTFKEIASGAELIVWSASPLTPFYYKKLKQLQCPLLLLFTGPFYTLRELFKAQRSGVPWRQLGTHWRQGLVPLQLTARLLEAGFVNGAVVLSHKNAQILGKYRCGNRKITVIPPGCDSRKGREGRDISPVEAREGLSLPKDGKILTYLGSLYQIRGLHVLLEAFAAAARRMPDVLLLVLARTNNRSEIDALKNRVARLGIAGRTIIVPSLLGKEQVYHYLAASDAVVLPFILVPSDMPLGALEAMALGKPVIATAIDGLPEMVAERGLMVPPGDAPALAQALSAMVRDERLYASFQANCLRFMENYPTWDKITEKFNAIIGSNI